MNASFALAQCHPEPVEGTLKYFRLNLVFDKFRVTFVLLVAFLFLTIQISAQNKTQLEQTVYTGFSYLYNYQFEKADSVAKKLSKEKNPLALIYRMNYNWWLIVSGEDNIANRQNLKSDSDTILSFYLKRNKKKVNDEITYYAVMAYAYKARLELLDKNYFSSVGNLNNCMGILKHTFGKEEGYQWFYLTTGLYNYFIEWGKQNYKILAGYTILYPKGDLKKGLGQLQTASKSIDAVLSTEGLYFYSKVNLEEEKKYDVAENSILELKKRYPQNILYQYLYFKLFLNSDRLEAAKEQYVVLNLMGISNKSITIKQRQHFSAVAKKDLEEYYIKKGKEKK